MASRWQSNCNGSSLEAIGSSELDDDCDDERELVSINNNQEEMELSALLDRRNELLITDLPKEVMVVDRVAEDADEEDSRSSELQFEIHGLRKGHLPYLGLIMAVLSSLFFSLCSLLVKLMDNMDPLQLAAFRFVGILLPTIPIVMYVQEQPFGPPEKRRLLILRAIVGAMSLMMQFYAIRHMPLGDASVVIFSAPVFVAIFARMFLKENCGMFNVIVIVLTLLGVVLITKPPFLFGESVYAHGYTSETLWATGVALVGTIFNANVYVLLRWLKGLHYSVIMLTFALIAIVMSFTATFLLGSLCLPGCGFDRSMILLLGAFSFAGQVLLTKSLQYEQAGPVAICRTADIVFAFIWQIIFFQQVPNMFSISGALLVTLSVVLTGVRKWLVTLPENSRWKRRLRFIVS